MRTTSDLWHLPTWILCLATVAVVFSYRPVAAAPVQDEVVRTFATGTDPDHVGFIEGREDVEADAPQAIYSDDNGQIYLLDQNNGRVLQFDPKRRETPTRSLLLPGDVKPTDLVVLKNEVFVWDNGPQMLGPSGDGPATRSLARTRSIGADAELAQSVFAQMGSETIAPSAPGGETRSVSERQRTSQVLPTRGRGSVRVNGSVGANGRSAELTVERLDAAEPLQQLKLTTRDRVGVLELLDVDLSNRSFVLVENIAQSGANRASLMVARFTAKGVLDGVYDLPLAEDDTVMRRFVTISPVGEVYFLRTRQRRVEVIAVAVRPVKATATIESQARPQPSGLPPSARANAAVRQPTRQQVVQTALAFEGYRWRVSVANYGAEPDTNCSGFRRIRRPGYLAGAVGKEVMGVPYCWGCHSMLNGIQARLGHGDLAGNVCTRDQPRRDVVGVDCSAFVSAAWGLSTHFTTLAIPAIARPLDNPWDLQPGDALNKPGSHVVLFLRFTPDRKVEVIEASPGRCNGRVCRNIYPLSAMLARGFVPVRYRGILGSDTLAPVHSVTRDRMP